MRSHTVLQLSNMVPGRVSGTDGATERTMFRARELEQESRPWSVPSASVGNGHLEGPPLVTTLPWA